MTDTAAPTSLLAAVLLFVLGTPVAAQRPHRSGFWIETGGGPSQIRVGCTGCEDVTRRAGSGGYLRLGGAVSDRVMFGVESWTLADETFGFARDDTSLVAENTSLAAVILWYPWRSGFFLKGGVGLAYGDFTLPAETTLLAEPVRTRGTGVGLTFGAGYDLPIWRSLALTTSAGVWVTAIGDIVLPAFRVDDVIATMYGATIGLTIR
jgi:hypothetical protein